MSRDVTFQYDSRGRRTGVTDELGNQTTYAYNTLDLVTSVTAPDPDGGGPLTAPVTTYGYDYFQRLTSVSQPGGGSISYTYDAAGNLLSLTDPVGNDTTYAYDGLGRLTIETNEGSQWRSYQYSALGDLTRLRDRNGRVLQFGYDLLGQLTSEEWRSNADPVPSLTIATTTQGGPANEVQRVGVTATFITGGTFTLNYNGQTTAAIAYNATAAQVQSALEALNNIAPGDVVVTKLQDTSSAQEWKLAFQGALGGANLVQTTIDSTNVWTMGGKTEIEATDTQGSSGGDEVQTVTLSNATGGTFRLAFEGYVTAPLAYNATAAQVDAALDALEQHRQRDGDRQRRWPVDRDIRRHAEQHERVAVGWRRVGGYEWHGRAHVELHVRCGRSTHGRLRSRQQLCRQLRQPGPRADGGQQRHVRRAARDSHQCL